MKCKAVGAQLRTGCLFYCFIIVDKETKIRYYEFVSKEIKTHIMKGALKCPDSNHTIHRTPSKP